MGVFLCALSSLSSFNTGQSLKARKNNITKFTRGTSITMLIKPGSPVFEKIFQKGQTTTQLTNAIMRSSGKPIELNNMEFL
jgi:hypothetical protein